MTQRELSARIKQLATVALLAFCALPFYLGYWVVIRGPELKKHPLNKRAGARMKLTKPGRIISRDGEEILGRKRDDSQWRRTYPSPRTFCHLTGYNPQTALQSSLQEPLLAIGRYADPFGALLRPQPVGKDVQLTISADGERVARRLLAGKRGAVVALNPKTGEVLVLASAPTYDPTAVTATEGAWEVFTTDPDSPALNRAVQGLFPPGSIFKLITAAAALERGVASVDTEYTCDGRIEVGGHEMSCWKKDGHGTLDMTGAIAQSCNVYFAHLGEWLGAKTLIDYARGTGLFERPQLPLPPNTIAVSRVRTDKYDAAAAASLAVGQGDLLITPFAAAQIAAALANGGLLMKPQLVKAVIAPDGQVVQHSEFAQAGRAFRTSTAELLAGMMEAAVETGTGGAARLSTVRVAGKTGSAQNPQGEAHAWFIGFAPVNAPRVAVAVIVENGGSGGAVAAPIARDVMAELLR